jgi:hypothetical protein
MGCSCLLICGMSAADRNFFSAFLSTDPNGKRLAKNLCKIHHGRLAITTLLGKKIKICELVLL